MRPKLRHVVVHEVEDGFIFGDPDDGSGQGLWLSRAAATIASLLDGTRTIKEFRAHLRDVAGADIPLDKLNEVVEALARAGLLDTPETRARQAAAERAYLEGGLRTMALAGRSFPGDRETFEKFISEFRALAPELASRGPLKGLVLPHLELTRVPEVYGAALAALAETPPPERVLLFGVAHHPIGEMAAALPLDLETPLGRLAVDLEAIAALNAGLPFELCNSPMSFRQEHSIEFPAALLHAAWPDATFTVVPLVVGGLQDPEILHPLVEAVAKLQESHPFFPVASVDLSHVGGRFGDPALDEEAAEATRQIDRGYIGALAAGRFDTAFESLLAAGNPTRIDAYASVQALHRALKGQGEVLAYQLSLEEETRSAVGAGVVGYW